jgi:O-antigen biosynthesis alpha-1,2-mannosyltransferase
VVSEITRQHVIDYLNVNPNRVHTVYQGVDEAFRKGVSDEIKCKIRGKYHLPERFLLYCGQIYPPKSFGRLLRAYAQVGPELGISLVVAGEHRWLCGEDLKLVDKLNISSWVVRPGWIGRDELPAFYCLAEALLLPSLYESFGIPLLEAMATGCPIVTSNRHGTQEVAGDAAVLVNPESVEEIADGMLRVVEDQDLRKQITEKGKERIKAFSWNKCARETLQVLEGV